ncbi:MAG: dTDP-glucose 4,6-dehydratase [Kiritimatiellae bacterium]|nr:dTDP-glucose 4,6-dehydratase [Kiritimatiellia bacterium]
MTRIFQNLLVTGGAGFIGGNFIHYLFREAGFAGRVVNFDALTYAGNGESLSDIARDFPDRYVFVHGDIRDAETVRATLAKYGIDAICHFAAESHVDRSILAPDDFVSTNIVGTHVLLSAARGVKDFKLFHHVSTDEVFGSLPPDGFFREDTPYAPNSPYSASKAASDHLVRAANRTFGLPVTMTNCSNNYGPYQFPEKLIPLIILNALEGKPLPVYGDGLNIRDWLFVTDHCRAIWQVMREGRDGETYNVGGRNELTNLEVVRKICALVDALAPALPDGRKREELITFVKDRPGHDRRYAIDCGKIARELGWTPATAWDGGFEATVKWYLGNPAWVEHVRSGAYRDWLRRQYFGRPQA